MAYASIVTSDAVPMARRGASDVEGAADDALMRRFRQGDAQAFEQLYRRHRAPLHRILLRLCGSTAEAEEVFQEVWLAVLNGAHRYEGQGRFAAWLYAIAHRRRTDRLRRLGRRRAAEAAALELISEAAHPAGEAALDAADLGRRLLDAIEGLPLPQREAFLLQAEGGLTLEEIARITGAGRETVKSRLRYANQRLRRIVEAHR